MKLLDLLDKDLSSEEVRIALEAYRLNEIEEDPPFRRYVGSRASGLDLLVESDRIAAIQIFVRPVQGFSSFPGDLPFGLSPMMAPADVAQLLGSALESDRWMSIYKLGNARLIVNFDEKFQITYLNVGTAPGGA